MSPFRMCFFTRSNPVLYCSNETGEVSHFFNLIFFRFSGSLEKPGISNHSLLSFSFNGNNRDLSISKSIRNTNGSPCLPRWFIWFFISSDCFIMSGKSRKKWVVIGLQVRKVRFPAMSLPKIFLFLLQIKNRVHRQKYCINYSVDTRRGEACCGFENKTRGRYS